MEEKDIDFARSSRRHKINWRYGLYVIKNNEPIFVPKGSWGDDRLVWYGIDQRGRELEVIAAIKPDCWMVIHIMPTDLMRGRRRYG